MTAATGTVTVAAIGMTIVVAAIMTGTAVEATTTVAATAGNIRKEKRRMKRRFFVPEF
jgi:hypothetical protein